MESPGKYVDERVSHVHFWVVLLDSTPALWGLIHLERGGIPLHDGVGKNCKKGATTDVKAQEPSIWAMVCMVGICACAIGLDMTTPP